MVLLLMLSLMGISVQAQEKKNKTAKHQFEVKGNCEMCKKRIEKAAFSVAGVKAAVWDMDQHTLQLVLDETKCAVSDVHQAIAKVGHDTNNVRATDAAYNKLHHCCKFDRSE